MTIEQENKVQTLVRNYLFKNPRLVSKVEINEEILEHVIHCGTDLLLAKWGMRKNVGSFVQSILDNNLNNTFSFADSINENFIKFYVIMSYNVGKPIDL